jgi:hypothetical protein
MRHQDVQARQAASYFLVRLISARQQGNRPARKYTPHLPTRHQPPRWVQKQGQPYNFQLTHWS